MKTGTVRAFALLSIAVTLAGCSASPVVSEWRNPAYESAHFKLIFVSARGDATSVRRNFEDEFVAQLRAAGIDALPSYSRMTDGQEIDEASVKQAARQAGADGAIFARSIQVERKTTYGPSYAPAPWFGFYGPHFGASWYGLYGAPTIYHYNEYTSETTLYDIAHNQVVWSGTIQMEEPEDLKSATQSYVRAVINALDKQNLLAAAHQ